MNYKEAIEAGYEYLATMPKEYKEDLIKVQRYRIMNGWQTVIVEKIITVKLVIHY